MLEHILKIEFLLNLFKQIKESRSKQIQKFGGGEVGGWLHQSLTATTEYIYPYDVLQRHYVEFVYENDILMRN